MVRVWPQIILSVETAMKFLKAIILLALAVLFLLPIIMRTDARARAMGALHGLVSGVTGTRGTEVGRNQPTSTGEFTEMREIDPTSGGGWDDPADPRGLRPRVEVGFVEFSLSKAPADLTQRVHAALDGEIGSVDCIVPSVSHSTEFLLGPLRKVRQQGIQVRVAAASGDPTGAPVYQRLGIPLYRVPSSGHVEQTVLSVDQTEVLNIQFCRSSRRQVALAVALSGDQVGAVYERYFQVSRSRPLAASSTVARDLAHLGDRVRIFLAPYHNVYSIFIDELRAAKKSVRLVGMTGITTEIAGLLAQKRHEGLRVECLVSQFLPQQVLHQFARARSSGLDFRAFGSSKDLGFRAALIDSRRVLTGSADFFRNLKSTEGGDLLVLGDPRAVGAFEAQFSAMWGTPVIP